MSIRLRRFIAAALGTTVVLSGLHAPAQAAPARERSSGPATAARAPAALARPIGTAAARPDPSVADQMKAPRASRWPTAGVGDVAVGTRTSPGKALVGGLDVRVSAANRAGTVRVRTLDRAASARTVANGPVVVVDGPRGAAPVDLSIGYADFAAGYGGDYGARLRLVRLPACAATTPAVDACRTATPVAHRNDPCRAGSPPSSTRRRPVASSWP